jgi:hypothetical protein
MSGLGARPHTSRTCHDETADAPAGCNDARQFASQATVAPAAPTLNSNSATSPFASHRAHTFVTPKLVDPRHFPDATDRIKVVATSEVCSCGAKAAAAAALDGAVTLVTQR